MCRNDLPGFLHMAKVKTSWKQGSLLHYSAQNGGAMKIEVIESPGKHVSKSFLGNAFEALKACGITGKVVVIRDIRTIVKYGVISTPALVINGMVMFAGNSPSMDDIIALLRQNLSTFT
jgi:predicted thioredoxin/glutaredoxin